VSDSATRSDNERVFGYVIDLGAFSAGFAWILGVAHVPVSYGERYGMSAIILAGVTTFISEGMERGFRRAVVSSKK
jgi:hypothetical protein